MRSLGMERGFRQYSSRRCLLEQVAILEVRKEKEKKYNYEEKDSTCQSTYQRARAGGKLGSRSICQQLESMHHVPISASGCLI